MNRRSSNQSVCRFSKNGSTESLHLLYNMNTNANKIRASDFNMFHILPLLFLCRCSLWLVRRVHRPRLAQGITIIWEITEKVINRGSRKHSQNLFIISNQCIISDQATSRVQWAYCIPLRWEALREHCAMYRGIQAAYKDTWAPPLKSRGAIT